MIAWHVMVRNLVTIASFSFWIVWATFAAAQTHRVAVISDLNGSYGSTEYGSGITRAIDAVIAMKPDLVIATGDMVAGQRRPHLNAAEIKAMWAGFHKAVTDPLQKAGIPFAVTPGNHDASAYGGFERERDIFAQEWRARRPDVNFVDDQNYPFNYAFDLGGVRFASLDITTLGTLGFDQDLWLARIMRGAPQTRVVFSHIPMWSFAQGRETEIISDPMAKALLAETGIDMHLSGHHHAFYPGASNGIAYVSQSCIGAGPRRLIGENSRSVRGFTIIDISADGSMDLSHFSGSDYTRKTRADSLPERLTTPQGVLTRIDLADLPTIDLQTEK